MRHIAVVRAYYYTDPACPWSWALEPARARLDNEFGEGIGWRYVMCGMAKEFGDRERLILEALEASAASGMPVDARIWLADPPHSSYPACISVKAANEQGDPGVYLRRLREGFMCRRRKLDTSNALADEARAVPGLDLERFRLALGSHGTLEAFGEDLELAESVPAEHHVPGNGRVRLPSLEFRGPDGLVHGVYGFCRYSDLRRAAVAAGARPIDDPPPGIEQALERLRTAAVAELSEVCQLPGPRAPAELWRLASEWRVRPERLGTGELWTLA